MRRWIEAPAVTLRRQTQETVLVVRGPKCAAIRIWCFNIRATGTCWLPELLEDGQGAEPRA